MFVTRFPNVPHPTRLVTIRWARWVVPSLSEGWLFLADHLPLDTKTKGIILGNLIKKTVSVNLINNYWSHSWQTKTVKMKPASLAYWHDNLKVKTAQGISYSHMYRKTREVFRRIHPESFHSAEIFLFTSITTGSEIFISFL